MTLEGALGPNNRLDDAKAFRVNAPEAICVGRSGQLLFSSGSQLLTLASWGDEPELWRTFEAPISALATSQGGRVAVGLVGGRIIVLDDAGTLLPGWMSSVDRSSVADCLFLSEDELVVVDHGYGPEAPVLSLAPWDDTARGQAIGVRQSGSTRAIATGLHCPMGVALGPDGTIVLTELERARIIHPSGQVLQAGYPGYLGRIRRTDRGYLLACLSRRDPLIEFLKTEREFVSQMKATVDPRHWISPRTSPEFSHDFPIELGATRLFGEIKPWAPSFSYGLIIEADAALMPVSSAHSRANGVRHAITDVASWNGNLMAVSRASGEILKIDQLGDVA